MESKTVISKEVMEEIAKLTSKFLNECLRESQIIIKQKYSEKRFVTLEDYYLRNPLGSPGSAFEGSDSPKILLNPEEINELTDLVKRSLENYPLKGGVHAGSLFLYVREALENLKNGIVNTTDLSPQYKISELKKIAKWTSISNGQFGMENSIEPYCSYGHNNEYTIKGNKVKLDGSKKTKEELSEEMIMYALKWWGKFFKTQGCSDQELEIFRGMLFQKLDSTLKTDGFVELSLERNIDNVLANVLMSSRIYKRFPEGASMIITDEQIVARESYYDQNKVLYTLEGGEQTSQEPAGRGGYGGRS